jgi:hypothetical protein
MSDEFFTDVTTLRARARQHIERGAVTQGYQGQLDVNTPTTWRTS